MLPRLEPTIPDVAPALADAKRLLAEHGHPNANVVSADVDSILFVGVLGHAITAWIQRADDAVTGLVFQAGFQIDPPVEEQVEGD